MADTKEVIPDKLNGSKVEEYRAETFEDMGFTRKEAAELSAARNSKGVYIHWTQIKRDLAGGANHRMLVKVYT